METQLSVVAPPAPCERLAPAVSPRRRTAAARDADVVYCLAQTRDEREAAFRIVHESYVRAGLAQPNWHGMRLTRYHLSDSTAVFVAKLRGEIISTVSLVIDGPLGLPMESMYHSAINQRRARGSRLSEVTCLADRRRDMRRFLGTFSQLTRLLAQYARSQGVDELLAAVHPRHAPFYSRHLGFEKIGSLAMCPHVQNHPAVGLSLEFARCDRYQPACYNAYFGDPLPASALRHAPLTPQERDHFRQIWLETSCPAEPGCFSGSGLLPADNNALAGSA